MNPPTARPSPDATDWLRFVTETAGVGYWRHAFDTESSEWSSGCAALLGIPASGELDYTRVLAALHPLDSPRLDERLRLLASAGEPAEFDEDARLAPSADDNNRVSRWVRFKGRAVPADAGAARLEGVLMDITARKHAESLLRRSEREFTALFDLADVGAAQSDVNGRFVRVNATFCEFTGYTQEELLKMSFWDITHPDDIPINRHGIERVLNKTADHWCIEKRYLRKDGSVRWGLLSAGLLRDEAGRHVFNIGIVVDITDRKRDEEAFRQTRAREHAYLENLPVGVWFLDAAGKIFYGNPAARQIWAGERHVSPSQFDEYKAWWHGTDRRIGAHEWAASTAIREGKTTLDEVVDIQCFDGSRKTMLNSAVPVRDEHGQVIGAVVFNQDITQLKRAEHALVDAQDQLRAYAHQLERTVAERTAELRETNEQLETFVYSVAHDLRAPLRALTGFSQLLVEDHAAALDPEGLDMLGRIQASSEFMDKLVLDLLAFGRTARAQMELGPVAPLVAWDIARFQCADTIKSTGAVVTAVEPLPGVTAHEATLGQMLANLLANALKFVAPGVTPHIRFRAENRGALVRLWVEDNGTGIAPDQHERIFRVFERLHGSTYPGTGIGLAIVRKGAERLGGAAGVESTPGEGSRFWIDLPHAPTAPAQSSA